MCRINTSSRLLDSFDAESTTVFMGEGNLPNIGEEVQDRLERKASKANSTYVQKRRTAGSDGERRYRTDEDKGLKQRKSERHTVLQQKRRMLTEADSFS